MKLLSWAICSLGIWVVLNACLDIETIWDDVLLGVIVAVLAAAAALKKE